MAKSIDGWIHSFTVTDTCVHKKGYTIYKITSIVFPACIPEALTCLTIWKRFNDVKKLHKDVARRHKELHLRGTVPALLKDALYFKRFERAVIEDRKAFILKLLDFCAQHPPLYKSHGFLNFFEKTHSPNESPEHNVKIKNKLSDVNNSSTTSISSSSTPSVLSSNNNDDNKKSLILPYPQQSIAIHNNINNTNNNNGNIRNIEKICQDISLNPDEYSLIDPSRDVDEAIESEISIVQSNTNGSINSDASSSSSSIITETNSIGGGGDDTFSNISTTGIIDDTVACSTIRRTEYHKQFSNDIVTDQLIDDQPIDYIYEAALEFNCAVQFEIQLNYRNAFEHYKKGIDTLLMGARNELEPNRKRIVKEKVKKYLNRAEDIYETYILNDDELNKKSTIIVHHNNVSSSMADDDDNDDDDGGGNGSIICDSDVDDMLAINLSNNDHELNSIKSYERPINQLAKFKVLKIIDNVMQVQDITNKKIFIMKAIQKSAITSTNSTQMFILPQNIPFMVSLLTFYQSETTIYLLLQQANGGKLWDYINAYQPKIVNKTIDKTISLNSLFTEPQILRTNNTETKSNNNECKKKEFNLSELLSNHSMDYDSNHRQILNNDRQHQQIPSHSQLSEDMDVIDLVNCSQKLLQSVTNTLEQIKDINDDSIDIDENLIKINTDNDNSYELAEEVLNSNLFALNNLCGETLDDDDRDDDDADHRENDKVDDTNELKSQPNIEYHCSQSIDNEISILKNLNLKQCQLKLPKEIIKRWASELIVAIIKLHEREIICFDLHPNNLLLGSNGELLLTYFYRRITNNNNCTTMSAVVVGGGGGGVGVGSKSIQSNNFSNFNELNNRSELLNSDALKQLYVAPERPLTKISDWWSIGVLLFELMTGHTFISCHPGGVSTYYEVQYPQIIPDISDDCKKLLNGLLEINPNKRLTGFHVQNHQYFENIHWERLTNTRNTRITTKTNNDENIIQC